MRKKPSGSVFRWNTRERAITDPAGAELSWHARLGRVDEARTEFEHLARSAARPDIREAAGKAAASASLRRR